MAAGESLEVLHQLAMLHRDRQQWTQAGTCFRRLLKAAHGAPRRCGGGGLFVGISMFWTPCLGDQALDPAGGDGFTIINCYNTHNYHPLKIQVLAVELRHEAKLDNSVGGQRLGTPLWPVSVSSWHDIWIHPQPCGYPQHGPSIPDMFLSQ